MNKYDIIGELNRSATERGWAFLAGDNFYQNIEATVQDINAGQLVLTGEFTSQPTFNLSMVTSVRYIGAMALGRKTDEDGQDASLDEDFLDKYYRRLYELMQMLSNYIGQFACDNGLEVISCELVNSINTFDTNIDFVIANVTFEQ